jgi:hypothetical protein
MRRRAGQVLAAAALAAALAGCGGHSSSAQPETTAPATTPAVPPAPPPPPTLTSPADQAACNALETNIRIVSQLISSSVEVMTQSIHPKQLATRTANTEKNLLYSAHVLSQLAVPSALVQPRNQLVEGLREFGADFGRAQKSVARDDLAAAARQLVDRRALAKVTASTSAIDRACGF